MPRKGMRNLLFSPKSSTSSVSKFSSIPSPSRPSFAESAIDRTLELAEAVIVKWDPDATTFARVTSLFHENRREAKDFIKLVNNIQKAMQLLVTENSSSPKLVRAQNLMQMAMKRLQKEFYQILSMNRAHLDPESVSTRSSRTSLSSSLSDYDEEEEEKDLDDVGLAGESIAEVEDASTLVMADLRTIAECMISSGYAKECVMIYKITRESIIDEGIFKLGVEKLSSSHVHKMDWEAIDVRIKNWLEAVKIAVNTLFNGERILSDYVFAVSESIRESCFADISRDGAMILFGFPENLVKNSKNSSDKMFRMLDMYTAISNYWPQMESIFSFESSAPVRSQAITSLTKIGEYVRSALAEFESAIQKDNSKSIVVGGGIHPLTIDSMNSLSLLADYSNILSDILASSPLPPQTSSSDRNLSLSDSDEFPAPTLSRRFAWLILSLLAKIDSKANLYRDVSVSYLFLANNHRYVVVKGRTSNLKHLLGDDWLSKQEVKVKQLASNYERLAWGQVVESLPEDPAASVSAEQAKEKFKKFNASFEKARRKQSAFVIPDSELRDSVKVSLARKILPVYHEFYKKHNRVIKGSERSSAVRFSPEDVAHHLSDLFFGTAAASAAGSSSSSSHSSSSHTRASRHR